jgi:hypothetical protein
MKHFPVEETRSPASSRDNYHPDGTGVVRGGQCRRVLRWPVPGWFGWCWWGSIFAFKEYYPPRSQVLLHPGANNLLGPATPIVWGGLQASDHLLVI